MSSSTGRKSRRRHRGIQGDRRRHRHAPGAAGASVVVNYSSSRDGAEKVVAAIEQAGGKAIAVGANVAKKAEIAHLFDEAKAEFGRLDILVNNAGIYEFAPLAEITEEHFHKQFNLNVLGLILATQQGGRALRPRRGKHHQYQLAGQPSTPSPTASVYSATKGAVDAVTKALAKELGPRKIRVNSLNPGLVETEGTHPPVSWVRLLPTR